MASSATQQDTPNELLRGWPILIGALVGIMISVSALPFYVAGVFVQSLGDAFGWSRTALSAGTLVWTLVLAAASPWIGMVVDRFGLRIPLAFSLGAAVICYLAFAYFLDSLLTFYLLQATLALFGAAASPITITRAVNGWFDRRRGLALGFTLMGTGIAAAVAPALVSYGIELYGSWRGGYIVLALMTAVSAPFVVWLVRPGPSDFHTTRTEATGTGFAQAVRSRTFQIAGAAFLLQACGVSGLVVHFVPMLTDAGQPAFRAAEIAGLIGIAIIVGRLSVGTLVDYVRAPYVATTTALIAALGSLALALAGPAAAIPAALAIGLAMGAEVDLIGFMTARYFGMRAYGRIYGCLYATFLIGIGVSPLWIGAVRDYSGSYGTAQFIASAILAVAALLFRFLPKDR